MVDSCKEVARGNPTSRLRLGEALAEHRQTAEGLSLCRLVLKHIPVFGENAVGDAARVRGYPGAWPTGSGEAAVHHYIVPIGDDNAGLVLQRRRQAAYKIEQPLAPGRDVRAVLDVVRRPGSCRSVVVALVEQGIECFEDE